MALDAILLQLDTELDALAHYIGDFAASKPSLDASSRFTMLDECLLEGLLSRVWQAWCRFCRGCVIESCIGTVNNTGIHVAALPDAQSEAHVSAAAIQAIKRPKPPYWGGVNTILRIEPTWGDVDALVKVVTRLRPTNAAQLLAAFSAAHSSAKALQLIRNGAAHNHAQNTIDIQTLLSAYVVFPIGHPTHALFWIDPKSSNYLVAHAIQELRDIGLVAIS